MRVLTDTPDRLVIRTTPWLFGAAVLAFALLPLVPAMRLLGARDPQAVWPVLASTLAGLAFLLAVRRTRLTLNRRSGRVEVLSEGILRSTRRDWPLADLTRAAVQTNRGSDGETFRAVLLLRAAGPQPIVTAYTSGSGPERTVEAVNAWLALDREPREG